MGVVVVKTSYILRPGIGVALAFDCLERESLTLENEITDHPVEVGANVTDHARGKPKKHTITGWVSNTPLNSEQTQRAVEALGITIQSSSLEDSPIGVAGYAENAQAIIEELWEKKELVTIVTPSRVISNMMIEHAEMPKDYESGDAACFHIDFKQITFAELQDRIVTIPADPKGKGKVDVGAQAAKPTSDDERRSLLHTVLDASTDGETDNILIHRLSPQAFGLGQ